MSVQLPDFKQQLLRDVTAVFHNPRDFAEKMALEYQGKTFEIWAVMDEEGTAVRDKNNNQRKNDHEKLLYQYDKYLWIEQRQLGFVPKSRRTIRLNGTGYEIREVASEFGEIRLTLRRLLE